MGTLVIGVGSEIRGDDGIGPIVASRLAQAIPDDVVVVSFDGNGLDLLSYFVESTGFDRVVVVDSLDSGSLEEGVVARVSPLPEEHGQEGYVSSHHVGILEVFALARRFGIAIPSDLRLYAIGIRPPVDFQDGLSEPLAHQLDRIVEEIAYDLLYGETT